MITLYQPPPCWGLSSMSPYCLKLETYMRMTKIEYITKPANFLKAPNGRVPYVKLDGETIGDSSVIIDRLKEKFGDSLDGALNENQKAQALVIKRMVENHLYLSGAWLRWTDDKAWKYVKEVFKPILPPVIGNMVANKIRKKFVAHLEEHGVAELGRPKVIAHAKEDIQALSILLGTKKYFLGENPSSLDALMYGFIVQQIWVPWDGPLKPVVMETQNLPAFCERMKSQYWMA